ncbi:hypothetical protein K4F52_001892 [Lecanicillium sp. MT-2017a]|nr:hypothetical protein K4F52_001892 [Lecanicillium sp. MT-2017a]
MASESQPRFIYKILPTAAPEPFPSMLPLSELDAKDGFVHLSTAEQVPKTADLFFTELSCLWVVKLEVSRLADPLKWEGGFPHLYGNFGAREVESVSRFERADGQKWAESMSYTDWLQ